MRKVDLANLMLIRRTGKAQPTKRIWVNGLQNKWIAEPFIKNYKRQGIAKSHDRQCTEGARKIEENEQLLYHPLH